MATPIATLLRALDEGRGMPFEWVVEHAPNGTLADVWEDSVGGADLLRLLGYAGDGAGLVRGAIACLRTIAPKDGYAIQEIRGLVGDGDPAYATYRVERLKALAWQTSTFAREHGQGLTPFERDVNSAVEHIAKCAFAVAKGDLREATRQASIAAKGIATAHWHPPLRHLSDPQVDAELERERAVRARGLRKLAPVVRSAARCPALADLAASGGA